MSLMVANPPLNLSQLSPVELKNWLTTLTEQIIEGERINRDTAIALLKFKVRRIFYPFVRQRIRLDNRVVGTL